jgi:hypothetical protein
MKINKNSSLQQFLPLSEAEIQYRMAKAKFGIFLSGFSLSSCPQHSLKSPLALIPVAPKSPRAF